MNKPSTVLWRPTTTIIFIVGIVALVVYSAIAYMVTNFRPTTEVRVGSGVYHLMIADDEVERVQGLSGVSSLKPDGGLLMRFDSDDTWGIWMKDMKIPLDIIWLNKDKKVVHMVVNASPELSTDATFTPSAAARYVIELPAGSAAKAAIKPGVTASFDETDDGRLW